MHLSQEKIIETLSWFHLLLLLCYTNIFRSSRTTRSSTIPFKQQIHLLPNTTQMNVRPYRYPHFRKMKLKTITYMLQAGTSCPSTSAFSSPVLLGNLCA